MTFRIIPELTPRQIKNFWAKVDKSGPSGCWIWTAFKLRGYGLFWVGGNNMLYAHRISFFLHFNHLDPSKDVAHHCDNPSCVNPNHLFSATAKENIADAARKGRMCHGEKHSRHKLSEKQVKEIRDLLLLKIPQIKIAQLYGINRSIVSEIGSKKLWKCVI